MRQGDAPAQAARHRPAVVAGAGLAVVTAAVLLALASTSTVAFVQAPGAGGAVSSPSSTASDTATVPPPTVHRPPLPPPSMSSGLGSVLTTLLLVAMAAAVVVLLVLAARKVGRRSPRQEPRQAETGWDTLPDLPATVRADAAAQQDLLARGTPRNAIVACWVRLQELCASAGIPPEPAETAADFTARVLGAEGSSGERAEPIGTLAALYREARFSSHEMGEPARAAATHALRQLHERLAPDVDPAVGDQSDPAVADSPSRSPGYLLRPTPMHPALGTGSGQQADSGHEDQR